MEFWMSLFKYDARTGRKAYLFNVLALIAIQLLLIAVMCILITLLHYAGNAFAEIIKNVIVGLIGLVLLYLSFVTNAKRVWDLTGDRMNGIWYSVGLFVACLIPFVNMIAGLVAFVFLFFIKGKDAE